MSRRIELQLRNDLISQYPSFQFQVKHSAVIETYLITVSKSGRKLSELSIPAETNIKDVWIRINQWMKPRLVAKNM